MKAHKYVIVGGGMAAAAAIGGIREVDAGGSIALIGAEKHAPYDRPPLSKALWNGQKTEDAISRDAGGPGIALHLGKRVVALDAAAKTVTDDAGNVYAYEKLLLATGGAPRRLPFADEGTIYFRTLDDYRQLRRLADRDAGFAVIGGGFIGSEVAAALAMNGKRVTMLFPEAGIGARVYPKALSVFLDGYFREKAVTVMPAQSVTGMHREGGQVVLATSGAGAVAADAVVAGLGILPAVELAQAAGLAVDNGILVDPFLRTSAAGIYAAGDVASYPHGGGRARVEHWVHAERMGQCVADNLLGAARAFDDPPFFWTHHYGTDLRYLGHGRGWTSVELDGAPADNDCLARYYRDGALIAAAAIGRDRQLLELQAQLQ